MALTGPILDDRSYEQLRDELVKRIPVYNPEWTDHNQSDPGIALLDLFAFLGESLLYRFNQIPDATKVAFLRLLGVQPRPAQIARTLLALQTDRPDGVQALRGREARAGALLFETDDEVVAWPLDAHAVGKVDATPPNNATLPPAEVRRRDDAVARLPQAVRNQVPAGEQPVFYTLQALAGDPLAGGSLDVSTTVDQSLWVALLARNPAAATAWDPQLLPGRTLFLGVAVDEEVPATFDLACWKPGDRPLLSASDLTADPPSILWELWTPPPTPGAPRATPPVPLLPDGDSTRGLTTTGVVKLVLPKDFLALAPPPQTDGGYTNPPPLDDDKLSARVIAWLRAHRPPGENDAIHGIRWVGANAVAASQARTAGAIELLGIGTGEAGQTYRLAQQPVVPGTVRLEVEEADGWLSWTEVDTLAASRADDRHYSVDLTAGEVRFGTRSLVPQIGQRIRVVGYRHGGGAAGNVLAGAITSLSGVAGVKVTNVLPATGGADAASLTEALDEIPAHVQRRDRAVTAEDTRALALEVPGVKRADTLPLLHPDTPDNPPAAGVVSVVVFPEEDLRSPAAPRPDTALLRRVAAYLDPRRLVTAELYVIPPTYRAIAVSVGVRVQDGYQADAVRRWVELILRQYLAPLPPDGPAGGGWPLGRAIRRAELEAVAVQVEGVEYVEDQLLLARLVAPDTWLPEQLIQLRRWEVPELAAVTVVAGSPLPPGVGYVPPTTPGSPSPVVVPLPPEVC
jgi:Baseplate J-like protein